MFCCQGRVKYFELHLAIVFSQVSSKERALLKRELHFVSSLLGSSAERVGTLSVLLPGYLKGIRNLSYSRHPMFNILNAEEIGKDP